MAYYHKYKGRKVACKDLMLVDDFYVHLDRQGRQVAVTVTVGTVLEGVDMVKFLSLSKAEKLLVYKRVLAGLVNGD